jgi:hypothetical protein
MGTNIGDLPPPFPNAAQSLSRMSGDAQLRERVERASESKPIKTDPDTVKVDVSNASNGENAGGAATGGSDARANGNTVDFSV